MTAFFPVLSIVDKFLVDMILALSPLELTYPREELVQMLALSPLDAILLSCPPMYSDAASPFENICAISAEATLTTSPYDKIRELYPDVEMFCMPPTDAIFEHLPLDDMLVYKPKASMLEKNELDAMYCRLLFEIIDASVPHDATLAPS